MKIASSFAFLTLIIMFFGCSKNSSSSPTPVSYIRFINASPDAPNIDLKANGTLLGSGIGFGGNSGFLAAPINNTEIQLLPSSGGTTPLLDFFKPLTQNAYYTVLLTDSLVRRNYSFITENITTPSSNSANVRFFNLAPNKNFPVDVYLNSALTFQTRTFNDQASDPTLLQYKSLPTLASVTGYTIYYLTLKKSILPNDSITSSNVNLYPNKTYTVLGLSDTSASGYKFKLISDN